MTNAPPTGPSRDPKIVTRFAPSPTGHLHIGGARTALFCWAYARRMGGSFLLRVEDTDQARSSEASAIGIMEDLAWLGIAWDQGPELTLNGSSTSGATSARVIGGDPRGVGPFYQSQRLDLYNRIIDEMIDSGKAYADFSSPQSLEAMRKAATAAKQTFRYKPADSDILPVAQQQSRVRAGEAHVVRLRAPEDAVRVVDEVLGEVSFAAGEVDDFVLRKADGFPTYHFGVVVDDELMGVTHVLRGQEHLMNTPRHVMLQRVLGYRTPVYAHMPLIFNDQGAKMSKRERDQTARAAVKKAGLQSSPVSTLDDSTLKGWLEDTKRQLETGQLESLAEAMSLTLPEVSVEDFRKAGYLPGVICNFIALLGWNPGLKDESGKDLERFDMKFLEAHFDLARIGKTNARFDRKKLLSFNGDAIGAMTDAEFAEKWLGWCARFDPPTARRLEAMGIERSAWLARAIRPRCKTLRDAMKPAQFAFTDDDAIVYDGGAIEKHVKAAIAEGRNGLDLLKILLDRFTSMTTWAPESIQQTIDALAVELKLGIGQVAQPLRVALTGTGVSPGLGETLAVLGKASVQRRIERCLRSVEG